MDNKLETGWFNCSDCSDDPFTSVEFKQLVESLNVIYDKIERCHCAIGSIFRCQKNKEIFVVNSDGSFFNELSFDSFEIYGKNFFVGKQNSGLLDWSNSPIYNFIVYDHKLNVLCITPQQPKYLGWRIIACQDEQNNVKLFNPYGEITTDYNIRSVQKFGGSETYWEDVHIDNPIFTVFEITESSTYRGLHGLLNIFGEVVLKPEFDGIEFDHYGNIKAWKRASTYNDECKTYIFDRFLNTPPSFLGQYQSYHALSHNLYEVIDNDGRSGIVNNQNLLIVPFEFDYIYKVDNGLAIFRKGHENGVIRLLDNKIIASSTVYDFDICNGFILCRSEHYEYTPYCTINHDDIEWYDKIEPLFNNFYKVKRYDKYGVIDSKGEKIIETDFNRILISDEYIFLIEADGYCYEGMTCGSYSDDNIGSSTIIEPLRGNKIIVLSKAFTPVINCNFNIEQIERTEIFSFVIKSFKGYGVFDSKFNLIIPPIFGQLGYVNFGYISDKGKHTSDGRFIFEDDTKLKILDFKYSYCARLNEKHFICLNRPMDICNRQEFKFGILDSNFNEVIPNEYNCIKPTFQDNLFLVQIIESNQKLFGYKWGVLNANNEMVISIKFDNILPDYESSCFIVTNNTTYGRNFGLFTSEGSQILDCEYKYIGKEISGFRIIFKDENWGIVNTSNGVVITFPNATCIGSVKEGFLKINIGGNLVWRDSFPAVEQGKWGIIDILGNSIIPCIYDDAELVSNNLALSKKGSKWGVLTLANEILIPFEYEAIEIIDEEIHCYIGKLKYVIFNFQGDRIGEDEGESGDCYGCYAPDHWDTDSEMDYIRNNGGDWMDD